MPASDAPIGRELAPRQGVSTAFANVAVEFLAGRSGSRETWRAYRADISRWLSFCAERGFDPVFPPPEAPAVYRGVVQRGGRAAPATVERRLATLSSLYTFAMYRGVVRVNPFARRVLRRDRPDPVKPTPAISREVVLDMLTACAGDADREVGSRDEAMIRVLYATGVRRGTLAVMAWEGVTPRGGGAVVRAGAKGGRLRDSEVPPGAWASVLRYWATLEGVPRVGFLFRDAPPERRGLRPDEVWEVVSGRGAEAGHAGVAPHQFRAAFVTRGYGAVKAGRVVEAALSASAGHEQVETTRRYNRGELGSGVAAALYDLD